MFWSTSAWWYILPEPDNEDGKYWWRNERNNFYKFTCDHHAAHGLALIGLSDTIFAGVFLPDAAICSTGNINDKNSLSLPVLIFSPHLVGQEPTSCISEHLKQPMVLIMQSPTLTLSWSSLELSSLQKLML